ncbi:hypothetical protein AYI68_g1546 [Smittium mucronatum]|uniref:ATP synthase subunit H, mitochondrial n=1 Tax=Smittium mucronatum TaxID=133383 RepID=A0A1R0H5D9_9FUNG|nr:hypothetical protein AYI68_g1546 [Smittium mucronatum]
MLKHVFTRSAVSVARPFSTSSVAGQDLLKDLYLKELRSFKPSAVKSDVQLKEFTEPKRPEGFAADIKEAEKELYSKDGVVSN